MENLTHSLVGLAVAKAGLERVSPYAMPLAVVAANAPDADIVTLVGGQFTYLEQHRGVSHSIVGTLAFALALPLVLYAGERLWSRLRRRPPRARLGGLLIVSLVASASHPLLDYTNNYGVRPLLPWDARWVYGDLVFIFDPWLWLLLGGACFLLTARTRGQVVAWALLALVLTFVLLFVPQRLDAPAPRALWPLWFAGLAALFIARRLDFGKRWGARLAIVSLALVVVYWAMLAGVHARAVEKTRAAADTLSGLHGESALGLAAMPTFADPLTWLCVVETDGAHYRFRLSLGGDAAAAARSAERFEKPRDEARQVTERASATDRRARIFLDFSRFPATLVTHDASGATLVRFADLRYTEPAGRPRGNFSLEVRAP
ncbi:MAG TPA: metal-dependent hydrolase [Pyrinomonadaceae bacterium]|nr:metal-dependent hydrolase [Pyrinomonadaceae bacterium]